MICVETRPVVARRSADLTSRHERAADASGEAATGAPGQLGHRPAPLALTLAAEQTGAVESPRAGVGATQPATLGPLGTDNFCAAHIQHSVRARPQSHGQASDHGLSPTGRRQITVSVPPAGVRLRSQSHGQASNHMQTLCRQGGQKRSNARVPCIMGARKKITRLVYLFGRVSHESQNLVFLECVYPKIISNVNTFGVAGVVSHSLT